MKKANSKKTKVAGVETDAQYRQRMKIAAMAEEGLKKLSDGSFSIEDAEAMLQLLEEKPTRKPSKKKTRKPAKKAAAKSAKSAKKGRK